MAFETSIQKLPTASLSMAVARNQDREIPSVETFAEHLHGVRVSLRSAHYTPRRELNVMWAVKDESITIVASMDDVDPGELPGILIEFGWNSLIKLITGPLAKETRVHFRIQADGGVIILRGSRSIPNPILELIPTSRNQRLLPKPVLGGEGWERSEILEDLFAHRAVEANS